jgi:hypothetical protein
MTWIKFEGSTSDKPEVWEMAQLLGIDPDAVVGKLLRVWVWFDAHTETGNAPSVTKAILDCYVRVTGFTETMIKVGWMSEAEGMIGLPNFDRHNGETAKKRATTAKRVAKSRAGNANVTHQPLQKRYSGNASVTPDALAKEDKKREDKKREDTSIYFSEWYSLYPRKVAKGEAVKAYARALKRIGGDPAEAATKLLEASKPRLLEIGKRDPQYQPNPATWLNGDGWQDEVKAINPTKPTGAGPGVNYDPAFDDQFMADLYTG